MGGAHGRPALITDDLTGVIAYNQQHMAQIPYGQSLLMASDATTGATQDDPSSKVTIAQQRMAIDGALSTGQAGALDAYIAPDAAYAGSGAAAGYPSVTVPDGYTSATKGTTPHGVQFLGTAYSEPKLIGLAYDFEQATHDRIPASVNDPAVTAVPCLATAAAVTATDQTATAATVATVTPSRGSTRKTMKHRAVRPARPRGALAVRQPARSLAYTGATPWLAATATGCLIAAASIMRRRQHKP